MKIVKIPGVLVTAIVVALTAWIEASFPGQWWLAGAVILLGAVAKLAELYLTESPSVAERMAFPPSKARRWFLG